MQDKEVKNYAFIDSQNLNLSIQRLGWKLDFFKFRVYLKEKYKVKIAYIFIGYVPENQNLYNSLQKNGYIIVFKPTLKNKDGRIKGNCDAELVLQSMIDYQEYEKAVIVTGDGDFYCLIKYLLENDKLEKVLIPDMHNYSALIKKTARNRLAFLNELKDKLGYKNKKRPRRTEP